MAKPKKKLTVAQRRAKRERKQKFMSIFINGKQKRVPRPQMVKGLPVDELIARNADPIWLVQNEMWEYITPEMFGGNAPTSDNERQSENDVPF